VQGWFMGGRSVRFLRVGLILAALFMIEGGWLSDLVGVGLAAAIYFVQKVVRPDPGASIPVRGAD
jgi:hypothetical protein